MEHTFIKRAVLIIFHIIGIYCSASQRVIERIRYLENRVNSESKFRAEDYDDIIDRLNEIDKRLNASLEQKVGHVNVALETGEVDLESVQRIGEDFTRLRTAFREEKSENARIRREIPKIEYNLISMKQGMDKYCIVNLNRTEQLISRAEEADTFIKTDIALQITEITEEQKALRNEITEEQKTLRNEITEEQKTLRNEITEEQKALRIEITEEQKALRIEITVEQKALRNEITVEQIALCNEITEEQKALRNEITVEQIALRNEIVEEQKALRHEITEEQKSLRNEITEEQIALRNEINDTSVLEREEFRVIAAQIEESIRTTVGKALNEITEEQKALRNEITKEQKALRNEITKEQKALRIEITEEQKALRNEITKEQKALRNEITEEQKSLRNEITEEQKSLRNAITEEQKSLHNAITEEQKSLRNEITEEQKSLRNEISEEQKSLHNEITEEQIALRNEINHTTFLVREEFRNVAAGIENKIQSIIEESITLNNNTGEEIVEQVKINTRKIGNINILVTGLYTEIVSCSSAKKSGKLSTGTYKLRNGPLVFCDQTTDGGDWTVFQRRINGEVNFYRNWKEYKNGFGDVNGEFWLGNEHLSILTSTGDHELRIDMEDFEGNRAFAKYSKFKIYPEEDKYKLEVSGFSGNASDSLKRDNGMAFTTFDNDNDKWSSVNCAIYYHGAWWYKHGYFSNLNGQYFNIPGKIDNTGIVWYHWKYKNYCLKSVEMKFR